MTHAKIMTLTKQLQELIQRMEKTALGQKALEAEMQKITKGEIASLIVDFKTPNNIAIQFRVVDYYGKETRHQLGAASLAQFNQKLLEFMEWLAADFAETELAFLESEKKAIAELLLHGTENQ